MVGQLVQNQLKQVHALGRGCANILSLAAFGEHAEQFYDSILESKLNHRSPLPLLVY